MVIFVYWFLIFLIIYFIRIFLSQSAFKIYTRGVYNFSDVNNAGSNPADAENNLVIDYEAFVVSVDGLTDGATHWVSAGIEYNNSYNVWIGQVSYTMKTAAPVSTGCM